MIQNLFLLLIIGCFTVSCGTVTKSTLLGASIGATGGGLVGNSMNSDIKKGTTSGLLVGAVLGGLVGYLGHKDKEKKEKLSKKNSPKDFVPRLSRPKIRRIKVKGGRKGNRYVEPHYEWIIEKNSNWTQK